MSEIDPKRFRMTCVFFISLPLFSCFYAYKLWEKNTELQNQITALQKNFEKEKNNLEAAQQKLKKIICLDSLYIAALTPPYFIQDSIVNLYREGAIASLFPDLFAQRKPQFLHFQATWNALEQKLQLNIPKAREAAQKLDSLEKEIIQENEQKKKLLDELNQTQQELVISRLELERLGDSARQLKAQLNSLLFEFEDNIKVLEFTKDGNLVYYIGRKKGGKANGLGVGIWSTGGVYKGEWKDNLRHGKGRYKWKDGEVYEGDFYEGKRTGKGKYIWNDGSYYIGQ
jgi:predicted transcriptional regulator